MNQPKAVLETKGLTMCFGGLTAVNAFNMAVPKGSIVGLIGPNGAGKTTVFNMITGFYKPHCASPYYDTKQGPARLGPCFLAVNIILPILSHLDMPL
jgi:ABC-type branched-subunit amino acid transport system ATPase component